MRELQLDDFPLDETCLFNPVEAYLLAEDKTVAIAPTRSLSVYQLDSIEGYRSLESLATAKASVAGTSPSFTVSRASPFSRSFRCTTRDGSEVARFCGPTFGFGNWVLELEEAEGVDGTSHPNVDLHLTRAVSQTEIFVHNSVPFFWTRHKDGNFWLSMVIGRKRQKIAEFHAQPHPHRNMDGL